MSLEKVINIDYASITRNTDSPALSTPQELGLCLVTGAAGLLGSHLVELLLSFGVSVRALIHNSPLNINHPNFEVIKGDLTDTQVLAKACEGVDTIFHAAAKISLLGGKYVTDQYRQSAWQANVYGTQNLLDSAQRQACKRFVFTSSIDVCFNGTYAPGMTEKMPYASNPQSVYGESKIEAEKRVLAADRKTGFHTCALRPPGIYSGGPNELIDRFLEQLLSGMLKMRLGKPDVKTDTAQIENLIHGHLLAALHLVDNGSACGQAYFINDNDIKNPFEFYRPIIESLGYRVPNICMPASLVWPFMVLQQALHFKLNIPAPMLSPHELDKISITHWASTQKARDDIGYEPIKDYQTAIAECVEYCRMVANRSPAAPKN